MDCIENGPRHILWEDMIRKYRRTTSTVRLREKTNIFGDKEEAGNVTMQGKEKRFSPSVSMKGDVFLTAISCIWIIIQ